MTRQENSNLKIRAVTSEDSDYKTLLYKHDELQKENTNLREEIKALSRIKNDQSKALENFLEGTEFPLKIKQLVDENKIIVHKNKQLEEKLKISEKVCDSQF